MQHGKENSAAVRDNPDHLSAIESLVSSSYLHCLGSVKEANMDIGISDPGWSLSNSRAKESAGLNGL